MRVLITGGAGFIGSNLLHYWCEKHPDDVVVCLDKLTYAGHLSSIRSLIDSGRIEFVKGDICLSEDVRRLMHDTDTVIHLAAESHVDRSIDKPDEFVRTNVLGTFTLLEEARRADIRRFHHVSTDEVFGSLSLDSAEKFNEQTRYNPRSPYAASKAASDHLVRSYGETYGIGTSISNCGNNFGPFQHPEKIIPRFITLLQSGRKVPIYGDGLNVRDWIYVYDHCSAIDAIVNRGKNGDTYMVSGRNELSNIELTRKILSVMGLAEDRIDYIRDRPGHDRRYALDDSKLRNELGWKPSMQLAEALKVTISWYLSNEWWWKGMGDTYSFSGDLKHAGSGSEVQPGR
ncbi:MAG: dTDP-glucose 4,6-dehydratase [Methanomassiliicoccales archaeon]|nr:dTDP-glucose 4,6-dehydratase [Methanomassiliicoccales archaeon]